MQKTIEVEKNNGKDGKVFYKLMNNAIHRKTMENFINRINVKKVNNKIQVMHVTQNIYDNNLVVI